MGSGEGEGSNDARRMIEARAMRDTARRGVMGSASLALCPVERSNDRTTERGRGSRLDGMRAGPMLLD